MPMQKLQAQLQSMSMGMLVANQMKDDKENVDVGNLNPNDEI